MSKGLKKHLRTRKWLRKVTGYTGDSSAVYTQLTAYICKNWYSSVTGHFKLSSCDKIVTFDIDYGEMGRDGESVKLLRTIAEEADKAADFIEAHKVMVDEANAAYEKKRAEEKKTKKKEEVK